jgi:glycine dehydrogenase subunit 1
MSVLGAKGLFEVAQTCHANAHYLAQELMQIPGVELIFKAPFFHEFVIKLPKSAPAALDFMAQHGIFAGLDAGIYFPELLNTILVCVTEKRTKQEMDTYVNLLRTFLED